MSRISRGWGRPTRPSADHSDTADAPEPGESALFDDVSGGRAAGQPYLDRTDRFE